MTSGGPLDVAPGTALGHEYSGEVVDVGTAVRNLRAGDRVTAVPMTSCGACPACLADRPLHCPSFQSMQGGYSEFVLIDARMAVRLPDGMDHDTGALVEPLASALRGIRRMTLTRGARVAILGGGAIGLGAAFWARRLGAGPIVVIARSRRSETIAAAMGADGFVTSGDDLSSRVSHVLGGEPDLVVEGAGVAGALQTAIDLARIGGSVLSMGGCIHADPIHPATAMFKDLRIEFSVAYGLGEFRAVIDAFEGDHFAPSRMIGARIGLDALPDRFEAMRCGSRSVRIVVEPHRRRDG